MDIFRSGQNIREACTADIGKGCRQNDLCQKTAVIGHHHLPLVLIIKIIGMLPDVYGNQRLVTVSNRRIGIGGFHDAQLAVFFDQPCPAGAELCGCGSFEFGTEIFIRAEIAFDFFLQFAGRLTAAVFLHTVPEKGMIPSLCGIIENPGKLLAAGSVFNNLFQRHIFKFGVFDQLVQIVDICFVMFAVMKLHSFFGNIRFQCVHRIRKRR